MNRRSSGSAGLYIHIPFCRSICPYCDFYSIVAGKKQIERFVESLQNEIKQRSDSTYSKFNYVSLFFGGGTPSLLSAGQLDDIVESVKANFNLENDAEITIECNPTSLDIQKLKDFRQIGINRLSLGIQSFNDNLLKTLGRIHNSEGARKSFDEARTAGFDNISIDLLYGIPMQSLKDWDMDLDTAIKLAPDHISAYNLIIEPNTPFSELYDKGELIPPPDNVQAKMYQMLTEKLINAGYDQYEISSFTKDAKKSAHNLKYWRCEPYLGLGPSAVSFDGDSRCKNIPDLSKYIEITANNKYEPFEIEEIDRAKAITEIIMMGLRLTDGFSLTELSENYDYDLLSEKSEEIKRLSESGLISITNNRLAITDKGLYISNSIVLDLI